jgi:hypothetical protein
MLRGLSQRVVFCISLVCAVLLAAVISIPRAAAQSIFVTPIPNVPFSAVVNIEKTEIRNDGLVLRYYSTREIARDTRGRIHNEMRSFVPASTNQIPPLLRVHLFDPQTRVSTEINVLERTFWTQTANHPPATEPPSIRFAAPDGNAPPSEFTKQEDLGVQEIAGVPAHGMRQTQTVTDEKSGKEIAITDEAWYSQELRVNVMMKNSDPRKGTTTITLSQVNQAEPDPSFFEIPEGYKPFEARTAAKKEK